MKSWDAHLTPLVDARYPALVAYARVLTGGSHSAAEDLVQDAIVRSFSRGRGFEDVHHAENYVRRAIVTGAIDGYRRRDRQAAAYSRSAREGAVAAPEDSVVPATDVERALALLSPRERACVVLRFYDDLPVADIAARLGIAEGSVKRYLSDASARLGTTLATYPDAAETVPVLPHR